MKRSIEVELRYEIIDDSEINLKFLKEKRVVDVYYDTIDGKFFKKGIFIRKRNDNKLDFKFNLEEIVGSSFKNDHTHCDEYSFIIPFQIKDLSKFKEVCSLLKIKVPKEFSIHSFLDKNSLVPLAIVDKIRKTAEKNGLHISVDSVKQVGRFIEVEKILEVEENTEEYEEELEKTKKDIDKFVHALGISVEQNETGYCELVLRKTNFDLYKQGRYLLDKDRK